MLFQSITEKITCQFYFFLFFFGKIRKNKIISVVGINFIFSLRKEGNKIISVPRNQFFGGKNKKMK